MTKPLALFFIISLLVVGVFQFDAWLDEGCHPSGVITWHGKVCFNDLIK